MLTYALFILFFVLLGSNKHCCGRVLPKADHQGTNFCQSSCLPGQDVCCRCQVCFASRCLGCCPTSAFCSSSQECCSGLFCIANKCQIPPCRRKGAACGSGLPPCCEFLQCNRGVCANKCRPGGAQCTKSGDCCQNLKCAFSRCSSCSPYEFDCGLPGDLRCCPGLECKINGIGAQGICLRPCVGQSCEPF